MSFGTLGAKNLVSKRVHTRVRIPRGHHLGDAWGPRQILVVVLPELQERAQETGAFADGSALKYYAPIGRQIQLRFDESIDNPRHSKKCSGLRHIGTER